MGSDPTITNEEAVAGCKVTVLLSVWICGGRAVDSRSGLCTRKVGGLGRSQYWGTCLCRGRRRQHHEYDDRQHRGPQQGARACRAPCPHSAAQSSCPARAQRPARRQEVGAARGEGARIARRGGKLHCQSNTRRPVMLWRGGGPRTAEGKKRAEDDTASSLVRVALVRRALHCTECVRTCL